MTDRRAKSERRLAAIMATDVVGYSKLMQSDEAGALAALAAIRGATQNQISQYRGRIAKTAGDSVLAEFGSAVEAVSCAMALQQVLSNRQRPTGPHWHTSWDVVDKCGDLFGIAIDVAARLAPKVTKRFLVLPCTAARWSFCLIGQMKSLVKATISLHIYHHLLFTSRSLKNP